MTYDQIVAEHRAQEEGVEAMRAAVSEVPVYTEREQEERYTFACLCGWRKTLHVDDIRAHGEKPVAPCGCAWECVECVG